MVSFQILLLKICIQIWHSEGLPQDLCLLLDLCIYTPIYTLWLFIIYIRTDVYILFIIYIIQEHCVFYTYSYTYTLSVYYIFIQKYYSLSKPLGAIWPQYRGHAVTWCHIIWVRLNGCPTAQYFNRIIQCGTILGFSLL